MNILGRGFPIGMPGQVVQGMGVYFATQSGDAGMAQAVDDKFGDLAVLQRPRILLLQTVAIDVASLRRPGKVARAPPFAVRFDAGGLGFVKATVSAVSPWVRCFVLSCVDRALKR